MTTDVPQAATSGVFSHEIHLREADDRRRRAVVIPVEHYVLLSAVLFLVGGIGFLVRRNVLVTLMSIEVMLNAANLALVAFNRSRLAHGIGRSPRARATPARCSPSSSSPPRPPRSRSGSPSSCRLYRLRRTVRSDEADLLKN